MFRRLRNFHRMCIGYAFRPHLSSRLTWSGRTFLQKPLSFGHYDSHIILATHSGILTRMKSTTASAMASPLIRRSPTPAILRKPKLRCTVLDPLHFRRRTTRPVSYYALFKCMAASEPTSWLFLRSHILLHLTILWDLSCGSGLFPS